MSEFQQLNIPNQNNKLGCDFFLHLAPPMNKFYSELLRTGYQCKNGKEVLTLEMLDYTTCTLVSMGSAITLPATGLRNVEFITEYMAKHNCTDTQAVGVYFFKVVKRETESND